MTVLVLKRQDVPVRKALNPLGVEPEEAPAEPTPAEGTGAAGSPRGAPGAV